MQTGMMAMVMMIVVMMKMKITPSSTVGDTIHSNYGLDENYDEFWKGGGGRRGRERTLTSATIFVTMCCCLTVERECL